MWRLERAGHSGDEFREALPCPAEPPSSLLLILGHRKRGLPTKELLWDERVCLCQDAAEKDGQSLGEAGKEALGCMFMTGLGVRSSWGVQSGLG